jgi:hypothetical protein
MRENSEALTRLLRVNRHLNDWRREALFGDRIADYRDFAAAQQTVATCLRQVKDERAHYAMPEAA